MIAVQQRQPDADGSDDLAAYRDPQLEAMLDIYVSEIAQSHQHEMRGAQNLAGAISYLGANTNRRFDAVDRRFDAVDARMDKLDARMDKLDARMDRMETKQDLMVDEMRKMSSGIERLTTWIIKDETQR